MSPRRRSTQRSFAISFAGLVIALAACSHGSGDSANPPSRDKRMSAAEYRYGLTFVSEAFVREAFAPYFAVETYVPAAIHDFQDLAVLRRL